ncbi:DUF2752 domain-containing protein [Pararhodonellum marinum]|uniref:DUF2752 domain-containing protein n=1 Tax=Pararhodonellum marinum TaxID=2755358 RepID=UPI00188F2804|nr:DUF2752 domain-containing protein [Pararhodonellum marinum]
MKNLKTTFQRFPLELIFWISALISISLIDPYQSDHFTLCPLDQLGFHWCPGCGLGRAMSLMLKGDFAASWSLHPLAGFAFVVITFRIIELIKHLKTIKYHG